jgi:hypothetical protein
MRFVESLRKAFGKLKRASLRVLCSALCSQTEVIQREAQETNSIASIFARLSSSFILRTRCEYILRAARCATHCVQNLSAIFLYFHSRRDSSFPSSVQVLLLLLFQAIMMRKVSVLSHSARPVPSRSILRN